MHALLRMARQRSQFKTQLPTTLWAERTLDDLSSEFINSSSLGCGRSAMLLACKRVRDVRQRLRCPGRFDTTDTVKNAKLRCKPVQGHNNYTLCPAFSLANVTEKHLRLLPYWVGSP